MSFEQIFAHRHLYAMNRILAILLFKAAQQVN